MRKIVLSMAAVSSLMFAGGDILPVVAASDVEESGFYVGAGLAALSARDSSVSMKFFEITDGQDRLGNGSVNAGYWLTEYLAIEGRFGWGFQDEDIIEMENSWSIFLKPTYKFDDDENRANGENYFAVYGLLGYGHISFKGVNHVVGEIDNEEFQWGLGVSYTFRTISTSDSYGSYRDNWTFFADYTTLGSDMEGIILDYSSKADADALSMGIIYHF